MTRAKTLAEFIMGLEEPASVGVSSSVSVVGVEPNLEDLKEFQKVCDRYIKAPPGDRDNSVFELACFGWNFGLPELVIYETLINRYNITLSDPYPEYQVLQKVRNAEKYAKSAVGSKSIAAKFHEFIPKAPDAVSTAQLQTQATKNVLVPPELVQDKKGNKNCVANLIFILEREWKEQFRLNDFADQIEFTGKPFWRAEQENIGNELHADDETLLMAWFSVNHHWEVHSSAVWAAALTCATIRRYHPVKEWLLSLVWDGVPRLDRILIDTMGATDDIIVNGKSYVQEVGKNTIMSAVKRIMTPGCKQDHILVIEGPQGLEKSKWCKILGGNWYDVGTLDRGVKDTYINLKGTWIMELPEINATFSKADFNWLKGVISTDTDKYRPVYGKKSVRVPRESIFIGTINPNATDEYLKDDENRRYWPVKAVKFNLEYFKQNRDQYVAEALCRLINGEAWHITDIDLIYASKQQQALRRETDPWEDALCGYLENKYETTSMEVYGVLGINAAQIQTKHRTRLYTVLRNLGWYYQKSRNGKGKWLKEIDWEKLK